MFVPLISHFFLHIRVIDMTHWLLPFANRTEMEEARKGSTPAVLKVTLAAFENKMLKEHLWPQAHGQLKEAWIAFIPKHFTQSSAGPSANLSKVATPLGSHITYNITILHTILLNITWAQYYSILHAYWVKFNSILLNITHNINQYYM